jgi:hypothetical protein
MKESYRSFLRRPIRPKRHRVWLDRHADFGRLVGTNPKATYNTVAAALGA